MLYILLSKSSAFLTPTLTETGYYTSGFARLRFWQFCLHWQAFCLVIDGSSAAKVLARFEYRLC